MHALIRSLRPDDEPFLWHMLYYAAHMQDDGEASPAAAVAAAAAQNAVGLQKYVQGWGRESDMGVLALHPYDQRPLGAAWLRLLGAERMMAHLLSDDTPELAIAVLPETLGQGIGTLLLEHLLAAARPLYPAVVLSVRTNNPARSLYERMGFVVVETARNRVGSESFVMRRTFS